MRRAPAQAPWVMEREEKANKGHIGLVVKKILFQAIEHFFEFRTRCHETLRYLPSLKIVKIVKAF